MLDLKEQNCSYFQKWRIEAPSENTVCAFRRWWNVVSMVILCSLSHCSQQKSLVGPGAGCVGLIGNFSIQILLSFLAWTQSFQFLSSLALLVHIVPVTKRPFEMEMFAVFCVLLPGHLQDLLKITQSISGKDGGRIPRLSQAWQADP